MEKRNIPDITYTWKEGKYFDLWIVPHILSGCLMAFGFLYFDFNRALAYGITFLIIAGWELGEGFVGVRESGENRVLDVVAGLLGFGIAYEAGVALLSKESILALLVFSLILSGILALFGWLDWRQRR